MLLTSEKKHIPPRGTCPGQATRQVTTLTASPDGDLQAVLMSLRGTPRGRENGAGLPADAGISLGA